LDSSGWPKNGVELEQEDGGTEESKVKPKDIVIRDFVTVFDNNEQMKAKSLEGAIALIMNEFNMESTNVAHPPALGTFFRDTCTSIPVHHKGIMYKIIQSRSTEKGDHVGEIVENFLKTKTNHLFWGADFY